jgi:hypothetical protein
MGLKNRFLSYSSILKIYPWEQLKSIIFHFTQISFKLFLGAIDVRSTGNQLELRMKANIDIFSTLFFKLNSYLNFKIFAQKYRLILLFSLVI